MCPLTGYWLRPTIYQVINIVIYITKIIFVVSYCQRTEYSRNCQYQWTNIGKGNQHCPTIISTLAIHYYRIWLTSRCSKTPSWETKKTMNLFSCIPSDHILWSISRKFNLSRNDNGTSRMIVDLGLINYWKAINLYKGIIMDCTSYKWKIWYRFYCFGGEFVVN